MNIIIKDDQGLDTVLMMDGYSKEQRNEARQAIRAQFRDTTNRVFLDILGKQVPETLTINMAISNRDELKGESTARLASYNVAISRVDSAVFTIREITVKTLLNHEDLTMFKSTVTHETFHAADKQMLDNSHRLLDAIRNDIAEGYDDFNRQGENCNMALLRTLQVFNHFRAEGVAILGESLLMKQRFGSVSDSIERFCSLFELLTIRARMRTEGDKSKGDIFDDATFHQAYAVAPIILLIVLGKTKKIDIELTKKALDCLDSGNYNLSEEEVITIMREALSLTLIGYIQGLTSLGNEIAPIRPFLDFCSSLQQDTDEDNMQAYEQLIIQSKSAETFNAAMDQIIGSCIAEEELDGLYTQFMKNSANDSLYPQLKEKVSKLYLILKEDDNPDRRRLAQWALTYLFDDEDLIHDDVSGLGLVDDMTIIDYSINLLGIYPDILY